MSERTFISKLMLPGDANPTGNVHGGTIMKLIDEAASIAAMRHNNLLGRSSFKNQKMLSTNEENVNGCENNACFVALARIDQMSFQTPVFVGEVAELEADVTFSSKRSLEVSVKVFAEDLKGGTRRLTNHARCWYIPVEKLVDEEVVNETDNRTVMRRKIMVGSSVVPVENLTQEEKLAGEKRYNKQKKIRDQRKRVFKTEENLALEGYQGNAKSRESLLTMWIQPDECFKNGNAQGGDILKQIDNACALAAFRHCRTNVVTASIEALDFLEPIVLGQLVEIRAKLIFTSNRSMEIKANVIAEDVLSGDRYLAVTANLIFVSLDKQNKVIPVMQLSPDNLNKQEMLDYEEARSRYEARNRKT